MGRDHVLYAGLALNVALLGKIVFFDPNLEFKPICFITTFSGGFETVWAPQPVSHGTRMWPDGFEMCMYRDTRYG